MNTPKHIQFKLQKQEAEDALRKLKLIMNPVDFSSNDYLGIANSKAIFETVHQELLSLDGPFNGATGSRLLSGNSALCQALETDLASVYKTEAALVFNSGYTANLGFFGTVPKRNDVIIFDELVHASIRDGIQLSHAKSYRFNHNDMKSLAKRLAKVREQQPDTEVYVVTESVFSMDGDSPDLEALLTVCEQYQAYVIIDEAHAVGVFGFGLVHQLQLQHRVWAQIITFGKAIGCHGAAILCDNKTKNYLINFCRPFIYTTGLSPHSVMTVQVVYNQFKNNNQELKNQQEALTTNIAYFKNCLVKYKLSSFFITSDSAIQCCVLPGNGEVKKMANALQIKGFDVRPILSPTVSKGSERLRFCLHSFNTKKQIDEVLSLLSIFVSCKKNTL